jgi:hypothetical protein
MCPNIRSEQVSQGSEELDNYCIFTIALKIEYVLALPCHASETRDLYELDRSKTAYSILGKRLLRHAAAGPHITRL